MCANELLKRAKTAADTAFSDALRHYWKKTSTYSCLANEYKEGRDTLNELVWNFVMMLLAFETYYGASGDERVKHCVHAQMQTYYEHSSEAFFLATGCGSNPAHDDAAWTAMGFLLAHRLTGDERALQYARQMIERAYDYWQDGSTANGLWYSYPQDNNGHPQVKSIYCAGLILSEMEYYEKTRGTPQEDAQLHQRTLALYEWVETHLRRDGTRVWDGRRYDDCDALYYCDFVEENGACHPRQCEDTAHIVQCQSWTSLFGNMAMAVINLRLHRLTGREEYLRRGLETANALVRTEFNHAGCFLNDRDAWTNTAFLGFFVREVLPQADPELGRMLLRTADAILKNACFEDGFYSSDWDGCGAWLRDDTCGEHTLWIPANATTMHVLFAAYAALQSGTLEVTENEAALLSERRERRFPAQCAALAWIDAPAAV